MAGWRERVLIGGIALSMVLHSLVLLGGHSAAPAVAVSAPAHGRKLQGLLDNLGLGGSGSLLGGLGDTLNGVVDTVTNTVGSVTGGGSSSSSGGVLGGSGGLLGLNVCSLTGGLTACDASSGDFTVPGKLTVTDGTRSIIINPDTQTITTSTKRLNIGGTGNPHTTTTGAVKVSGAVSTGNTRFDQAVTINKGLTATGIVTARANVNVAGTLTSAKCTCAGKPASG